MKRPICTHCGKAYGKRSAECETVRWHEGEEAPAYKGNGVVIKESDGGTQYSKGRLRAMYAGQKTIGDWHQRQIDEAPEKTTRTLYRYIWDGESWYGGYDPFCTLRCALAYARKAYNARRGKA